MNYHLKVDLLIQYFDWMYTSKENYELCAYGVKGAEGQWIESQYGDEYYDWILYFTDDGIMVTGFQELEWEKGKDIFYFEILILYHLF